jgi:hypothetical protein
MTGEEVRSMKRMHILAALAALSLTGCLGGGGNGGPFPWLTGDDAGGGGADGCPAHAHREEGQCVCDDDYAVGEDNLSCVRVSCPPRMHPEGEVCACDDIYEPGADGAVCVPLGASVQPGAGPLAVAEESLEIKDDSNGDGLLNPGETLRVYFDLVNTGDEDLDDSITGLLSADSPWVTWRESTGPAFGDAPIPVGFRPCAAGDLCDFDDYSFSLSVLPDTPAGTVIPISIHDLKGGLGVFYADAGFSLTVLAAGGALGVLEESLEVKDDSNGDGLANPGEILRLYFDLENTGVATVTGPITGLLASDGPWVTWRAGNAPDYGTDPMAVSFEACAPGDVCDYDDYSFYVSLAPGTPAGAPVVFTISGLVDGMGQPHPDLQLSLPVEAAGGALGVATDALEIKSDDDGDGRVDPGETMKVYLDLENTGTATVTGPITGRLASNSPWVTWKRPNDPDFGVASIEVSFGACASGAECQNDDWYFNLSVDPAAPTGTALDFSLSSLVDGMGQPHPDLGFSLHVAQ